MKDQQNPKNNRTPNFGFKNVFLEFHYIELYDKRQ